MRVESTGFGAVCPRPHSAVALMALAQLFQLSQMSPSSPRPSTMLFEDFQHALGADAARRALAAGLIHGKIEEETCAISTMQVSSSMTIMPPEPIMEPMAVRLS